MESNDKSDCNFKRYEQAIKHANKYFEFLNSRVDKKYSNPDEYFKDLDIWLNQTYYFWNLTAKFPHYLAQQQYANRINSQPLRNRVNGSVNNQNSNRTEEVDFDGIECCVPALWKRLAAEFIDFLILLFLKMAITLIIVDFFDFVDWDKFAVDLFQGGDKIEYNAVVKMTQDLVILELVHRIVVAGFETYWVMAGREGRLGGATPGKSIMGLRVLACTSIDELPSNGINSPTILVKPGTDPGLQASFWRSISKNLMMMLFYPATFFLYYFRHNRTAYDLLSGTIVVEEPLIRRRRNTT